LNRITRILLHCLYRNRICISSIHCEEPFAVLAHRVQIIGEELALKPDCTSAVMLMFFLHMQ
jgi:hypothetical protein